MALTSIDRDIGGLEARMDEHDKRLDRLERKVDDGFEGINRKLDGLRAEESRRKGAMTVLKLLFGAGSGVGLWEIIKGLLHR